MTLPRLAACLLVGLTIVGHAQEPGSKPRRPIRPDPDRKNAPLPSVVKLPDDFVQYARLPEGGLRPVLGVGKNGVALIYWKGEGTAGDLYLSLSPDEARSLSSSVRVNPVEGTVVSWKQTQSASIDIGPDERVHVAWISAGERPSLQYVRTTPSGELEGVQDLGAPGELGTTTAVTVDDQGQVYVFYSAGGPTPELVGHPGARIWLRRSPDGTSFDEPVAIDPNLNVSTHSALAAHVDEVMGTLYLLYRTAFKLKEDHPVASRSMRLLSSKDRGETFSPSVVDNCRQVRDPLSSASLAQEEDSTLAAWDVDGRVCWSIIRRQLQQTQLPVEPKSLSPDKTCTHAVGAASGDEVILTWLERPASDLAAPPRLGWQVWLRQGRISLGGGQAPEPALGDGQVVVPRRAGGFTIVY